jgi:hypothetical protein
MIIKIIETMFMTFMFAIKISESNINGELMPFNLWVRSNVLGKDFTY